MFLAGIHALSVRLRRLDSVPRSRCLSFSGGVSVSLVFLEILPGLGESQDVVERGLGDAARSATTTAAAVGC